MMEFMIYITVLIIMTVAYFLGRKDTKEEFKHRISLIHKGESNDLMDKGWNEAIEYITKNIL